MLCLSWTRAARTLSYLQIIRDGLSKEALLILVLKDAETKDLELDPK